MTDTPIDIGIDAIAAGGAGVGRTADGLAIFVQRTAPGERVRVEIIERKARWARGRALAVLEPSPQRRAAPCRFYDRCGGCTLEHLHYDAQLQAKGRIVADALQRIGGLAANAPTVEASPAEFGYRNRVSFTLVRTGAARVVAGFHEIDRADRVLDIDETCLLPEPAVAAAWGSLRQNWGRNASRLPSGRRIRLTVRSTAAGRTALLVQGGYGPGRPHELLPRVDSLEAIWHQPTPDRPPVLLAGEPRLSEKWRDEEVGLGGATFLQVNRRAAVLLEDHVIALAGDVRSRTVVDAYCGAGFHARRLSRVGARVTGIELDQAAVDEARAGAPDATFVAARVEVALAAALPADLVIVNPPRAGLHADVIDALLTDPPDRVIYVSCDPATFARDLKRLAPPYTLGSIRAFDLFPQTAHVETVAELTCSTT